MARYTFELRELIATFGEDEIKSWFMDYELSDFLDADEIKTIQDRGVWSKEKLANRIIGHFYLREIGTDATGSFKLYAKDLMNELMETYAPLIYSASIKYDPLVNVDFVEEYSGKSSTEGTSNTSTNSNGSSLDVSSDTPQGQISKEAILRGDYASSTSANENENNVSGVSENAGSGVEEWTRHQKGNSGSLSTSQKLIEQYRNNIRAINTEIIYALEPLFMALY